MGLHVCLAQFNGGNGSGNSSITITNSACSAATMNLFGGGSGSGASMINITNSVCSAATPNAFGGGSSSGFSSVNITNSVCSAATPNAFGGGSSSGYSNVSITNSVCSVTTLNAFGGGDGNGYSDVGITNSVCSVTTLNAFSGGNSDGGSSIDVTNSVCSPITLNAFSGGDAGGHSSVAAIVLSQAACATLPIELIFFDAVLDGDQVLLQWQTATETNNDYFTLEKSVDGQHFFEIKRIKGAGNSSQTLEYTVIDFKPFFGVSYYRLKQTDYNGDLTYSSIEVVTYEIDFSASIEIVPNPVTAARFSIEFTQPICDNVSVSMKDVSGKVVTEVSVTSQSNRVDVSLSEKPVSGVYLITISCEQFSDTRKVVFK